jgi:NADH-quinone oxidoreductase subunit G
MQLVNHPLDCPTCDQAGECKLQDFYMDSGFYVNRVNVQKNNALKKVDLGSNVMLDQERCVLCTRCVRFTQEYSGTGQLGVLSRADHSVISTFPGTKLDDPYAMNVVDLCPVGALTSKDFRFKQRSWFLESFHAVCNGCSRGCNIQVDHRKEKYKDDTIYRFRPLENHEVNGYFMCDEGRLSYKNENENRLLQPLINNKEASLEKSKEAFTHLLKEEKNVLFLVSPVPKDG